MTTEKIADEGSCPGCKVSASLTLCPDCLSSRLGSIVGGRFRLLRLLGEGGMGAVFEVRHEVLGRRFAVKVLHSRLSDDRRQLERFRREALATAQIESQHVAAVVDLGTCDDGVPFIVFEYLEGQDLASLLARERLSVMRALEIMVQACKGVAAAHARGFLHRDLKPANLFICQNEWGDDLVKVLDFGIAKLRTPDPPTRSQVTASGVLLGTPAYMAPEQAMGEPPLDGRADIYSLGAILYECLSGRPAFGGKRSQALLFDVMFTEPPPLDELRPELPPALVGVVTRAMSKRRELRHATVAALGEELEALMVPLVRTRTTTSASTQPITVAPPSRPSILAWRPLLAIAVAAVLIVSTAQFVLSPPRSANSAPSSAEPARHPGATGRQPNPRLPQSSPRETDIPRADTVIADTLREMAPGPGDLGHTAAPARKRRLGKAIALSEQPALEAERSNHPPPQDQAPNHDPDPGAVPDVPSAVELGTVSESDVPSEPADTGSAPVRRVQPALDRENPYE